MMNKLIEKMEKEFDKLFDHFNDLYIGHMRNDDKEDVGKQICSFDCEKVSDLSDVKVFFRSQIPILLQAVGEEIIGKDSKHKLTDSHRVFCSREEVVQSNFCTECRLINQEKEQQRSRLKEVISEIQK